jgi:tetratricopeptide (TPR) repeat protein
VSNISSGGNYYGGGGNYYGGGWGGGLGGWGMGMGLGGWGMGMGLGGWDMMGFGGWGGDWGGGWAAPLYGDWYDGWGGGLGSLWGGYGLGAATSMGMGAAIGDPSYDSSLGGYGNGDYGYPVYGGYGYGTGSGVYDYFPTWGVSSVGDWGLDSMASSWLSSNYANPYSAAATAAQPGSASGVYDYSQPINVNAAPSDPNAADSSEQVFSAAREAFKAGDYQRALDLTDQVIKSTPNAPVVHEFRALCLFALKRYDDAASAAYAVLSAGPCWSWSTMVGLYPDVDTYTSQLRALEASIRSNLNATPPRFLLAYQYLVQGNNDAAGMEFAEVAKNEPKDQLSASFAKALAKAKGPAAAPSTGTGPALTRAQPTTTDGKPLVATSLTNGNASAGETVPAPAATSSAATAPSTAQAEAPPPPPAQLTGNWKATPSPDTSITLALDADGAFKWDVAKKGQQNGSISGRAYYVNNVLSLTQEEGPPLAGKVESKDPNKFVFRLMGGGNSAPALTFTR